MACHCRLPLASARPCGCLPHPRAEFMVHSLTEWPNGATSCTVQLVRKHLHTHANCRASSGQPPFVLTRLGRQNRGDKGVVSAPAVPVGGHLVFDGASLQCAVTLFQNTHTGVWDEKARGAWPQRPRDCVSRTGKPVEHAACVRATPVAAQRGGHWGLLVGPP